MAKYEIDMKVLPGLGAGGHIDRELGQCKPGEVIECTQEQAAARNWLKPVEAKKKSASKKKSSKPTAAEKLQSREREGVGHGAS